MPDVGQHAGERRAGHGAGDQLGELGRTGERPIVGDGSARGVVGVHGGGLADDPSGAWRAELCDHPPVGVVAPELVVAGPPQPVPIGVAEGDLLGRQLGEVSVGVDEIGKDAHPQLGRRLLGSRAAEAGRQPHGKHRQRQCCVEVAHDVAGGGELDLAGYVDGTRVDRTGVEAAVVGRVISSSVTPPDPVVIAHGEASGSGIK